MPTKPKLDHILTKLRVQPAANPILSDFLKLLEIVLEYQPDRDYGNEDMLPQWSDVQLPLLKDLHNRYLSEVCVERSAQVPLCEAIDKRRVVKVIGKPGTGKTTLLHQTARILSPRFARVYIDIKKEEANFREVSPDLGLEKCVAELSRQLEKLVLRVCATVPTHSSPQTEAAATFITEHDPSAAGAAETNSLLRELLELTSPLDQIKSLLPRLESDGRVLYIVVDNVDELSVTLQRGLLQACLKLSNALERTVVFSIRDINMRRLTVQNLGADFAIDVELMEEESNVKVPLAASEFQAAVAARIKFLLTRPYVKERFMKLANVSEGYIDQIIKRQVLAYDKLIEILVTRASLIDACNASIRRGLVLISATFRQMARDPLIPTSLNKLMDYIWRTSVKDVELTDYLYLTTQRCRTFFYRTIFDERRLYPDTIPDNMDVWLEGSMSLPSAAFVFPSLALMEYISGETGGSVDVGVPWARIVRHFNSCGENEKAVRCVLERLTRRVDINGLGFLWVDCGTVDDPHALVFMNPSGRFFLNHFSPSLEYLFWSLVNYEWSDIESQNIASHFSSVNPEHDFEKALFVAHCFERYVAQGLNIEVGHKRRHNAVTQYRETHMKGFNHLSLQMLTGIRVHIDNVATSAKSKMEAEQVIDRLSEVIESFRKTVTGVHDR